MIRHGVFILWGVIVSSLLVGCGGFSAVDRYQSGRASRYAPGIPSFDFETVPSVPGRRAGFDLYLSIPSTSLTFEKEGNQFWAMHEVRVALHTAKEKTFVMERTWTDTTAVSSYRATQRHDPFLFRRHLDAPPGEFEIEVTLENLSSQKSSALAQLVAVPDSAESAMYMGKILIQARTDRRDFLPVVASHVPSGLDSLECVTTLYNLNPSRSSLATLALLRYQSDTIPALPPMDLTTFDLPLGYGMLRFERPETVQVQTRPITAGFKEEELTMGLRGLPAGNYLAVFQVHIPAALPDFPDTLLRAERFISLGGPTFPRPSTLSELIESMLYIARRPEMKLLREAPTPEIARARFDSLWLSFRSDKKIAADMINKYYSRVEEANRRFTSTKEGWRTDQGMLFIILGPPVDVRDTRDQEIWYYDMRGGDAVNVYTFQRRFVSDGQVGLMTFTLLRQAYYDNLWTRMVDKWRSGEVF